MKLFVIVIAHICVANFCMCYSQESDLEFPDNFTNSVGMQFQLISAGKFSMGSAVPLEKLPSIFGFPEKYGPVFAQQFSSEQPYHSVELSRGFYSATAEVTRKQFKAFVDDSGFKTEAERDKIGGRGFDAQAIASGKSRQSVEFNWMNPGFPQGDDHPVTNVSWNDATEFCLWLSKKEGREYSLPTEAQWEFACRATTKTLFHSGNRSNDLANFANVLDKEAVSVLGPNLGKPVDVNDKFAFTAPTKSFKPNANQLHDMHGNVAEWCQDWHAKDYYAQSPPIDPTGPETGQEKVLRGGSWVNIPLGCRSAARAQYKPNDKFPYVGFRVFLALPE